MSGVELLNREKKDVDTVFDIIESLFSQQTELEDVSWIHIRITSSICYFFYWMLLKSSKGLFESERRVWYIAHYLVLKM